jgi:cytochrome c
MTAPWLQDGLNAPLSSVGISTGHRPFQAHRYPQGTAPDWASSGSSKVWFASIALDFGDFRPAYPGELKSMSAIRPIRLLVLAALLATPAAYAGDTKGDAANGKELFMANACVACHGVTKGDNSKVGPSLFGIVGRKAGTAQSLLGASENLKKYGVTWSTETLDEFLANPNAKVPGTPMVGMLADPQQRADVIAYLFTLVE